MAETISLTSIAIATISLAASRLRPQVLQRFASEPDTSLRILRNCRSPIVDIVCVPDLSEDPLTEWTKSDNELETTNWLTDLLPISLPEARILLFEYAPKTRTLEGFTRQTIHAQAYELLGHLWATRRGTAERRPLLFLARTYGALIARSAIFQSSAAVTDRDSKLRSIYLSTGAVFIIDAVQKPEELSKSWKDILEKAMDKIPHPVVKTSTSKAQSAEWFEWQQDRFRAITSTIATTTVVVKTPSRKISDVGQRLLSAAAAYKNMKFLGDRARIEVLERNTTELMKYASIMDSNYKKLLKFLTHSIEVGTFLSQAKWSLESVQRSLVGLENDRWISEVETEYERQLEQSVGQEGHWHTEAESKFVAKQREPERQRYQRRPSTASTRSLRSSDRSAPKSKAAPMMRKDLVVTTKDAYSQSTDDDSELSTKEDPTIFEPQVRQDPRLKQLTAAQTLLREIEESYGFSHARTLECLNSLATRHIEMELLDTAESIMQRLLVSWHQTFGLRSKKVLQAIQRIAAIKVKQRRYADASAYLSKAVDIRFGLIKDTDSAISVEESKTEQEKENTSSDVVERLTKEVETHQEALARCQIDLAIAYDMQERFTEAEAIYTEVLLMRRDQTDPCRLLALENQALHWRKMGKIADAAKNYEAIQLAHRIKTPPGGRKEQRLIESKLNEAKEVLEKKKYASSYF